MQEESVRKDDERSVSRLVLGFDGGCGTCFELAKRIDREVGDKLEVQNLRDERVMTWREETLGKDAPWAPTLFEVSGRGVRAWTGWRMGIVLSRSLGASGTWRVMKALGEMNTPREIKDSIPSRVAARMSRGQFLKGVGGTALAFSVLSATDQLISPAEAAGAKKLSGDELEKVGRAVAGRGDLRNVLGAAWANGIKRGTVRFKSCQNGDCVVIIGSGSCSYRRVNGSLEIEGNCSAIRAARHTLSDGSSRIAVSYQMSNRRVAHYHAYANTKRRTKTESILWKYDGGARKYRRDRSSHNGRPDKPVPRMGAMESNVAARSSSDPCGGCPTNEPSTGNYFLEQTLESVDPYCLSDLCGACSYAKAPPVIFACALTLCLAGTFTACSTYFDECYYCAGGGPVE